MVEAEALAVQREGSVVVTRPKVRWYVKLVVVGFAVLLALLVGELAVRVAMPMDAELAWRTMLPDRDLYIVWKPDSEETRFTPWGSYDVRINHQGLRMDRDVSPARPAGVTRIAAVGDSFVFGAGVQLSEAFVTTIENELKYSIDPGAEVLNFGVGGYNMGQNLLRFKRDVLPLNPDHVFVFYCFNDLESNRDPLYINPFSFEFKDGSVEMVQRPAGTTRQRLVFNSGPYIWLRQRSHLMALVLKLLRSQETKSSMLAPDMAASNDPPKEEVDYDQMASDHIVRQLATLARDNGVKLWLIFVPSLAEMSEDNPRYRRLCKRNAELAGEFGFEAVDPTLRMRTVWAKRGRPEIVLPDFHYNRIGNLMFGKVVAEMIQERWNDIGKF
jgi:hypothetical protein